MQDQTATAEVRAALFEFQRYLSDQVAPLMVVDSVETLLRYSPVHLLAEIQAWTSNQFRGRGASVPVSDYLYHAMKKVQLLGDLDLLPETSLRPYFEELGALVLEACPPEDRDFLRSNLTLLGQASGPSAPPVDILHRQAGGGGRLAITADGSTISDRAARSLEHVTALLERIQLQSGRPISEPGPQRMMLDSHAISAAALGSENGQEFRALMGELKERGIDTRGEQIFRALSATLPAWAVPAASGVSENSDPSEANPLQAMHKIISLAEDPGEGARRFREMLDAAIEQFNAGDLSRAATMFELAERIVGEKRVDDSIVSKVRATAHEELNPDQLKQAVEMKEKHFLLRRIFHFFTRLTPEGLLTELETEDKRDRRRSLLAFLEVHGAPARDLALQRLLSLPPGGDTQSSYFARNLLYVLTHITRPPEGSPDKEIDAVAAFTTLANPIFVIKEGLSVLAQIRTERSEKILHSRLRDLEGTLVRGVESRSNPNELRQLLDRVIASLLRIGSSSAIAAVVEHGLKTAEPLGDTRGRLATLGTMDLSEYHDSVTRLVAGVRSELPTRVLGFVPGKKQPQLLRLLDALTCTPAPAVREVLEEISQKFPNRDFSEKATAMLNTFGAGPARPAPAAPAPTAPSISGDLELFGLPNLLQSLGESGLTGTLSLTDPEGLTLSTVGLDGGKIVSCRSRLLRGREALFQLFERPSPGNFAFYSRASKPEEKDFDRPLDVTPLIMEAMRRFDELRRGRLLVPETMSLRATGTKPVPLASETDASVVREVWMKATSGLKPAEWERQISADSYRVWRLLAHWVESGALEVVH